MKTNYSVTKVLALYAQIDEAFRLHGFETRLDGRLDFNVFTKKGKRLIRFRPVKLPYVTIFSDDDGQGVWETEHELEAGRDAEWLAENLVTWRQQFLAEDAAEERESREQWEAHEAQLKQPLKKSQPAAKKDWREFEERLRKLN